MTVLQHEQSGHDGVDLAAGEPPQSRFLSNAVQVIRASGSTGGTGAAASGSLTVVTALLTF